jgi:uncharacterized protein YaiE (UPF0345 family)
LVAVVFYLIYRSLTQYSSSLNIIFVLLFFKPLLLFQKNKYTAMKKTFLICMLAINITSYAQTGVAVNTTGAAANSNAMLDVSATNKGMLVPRVDLVALTGNVVTSFGISATPTTSLLVYNTTASVIFQTGFYFWDGSLWTKLNTGATSSVANAWSLTGNASTTASNYIGTTDALPLSLRTAGLDRMSITSAGNVGIGTTAPVRKLHIVSGAEALRIEGTNNWIGFAESALGTYNGYLYQTASNFILGTISGSTKNIQLSPKGIPALTALATGEIGIGTTAPQALLEVKGASNPSFTPTLKLVETSASAFSRIHFTNPTGSSEWHIKGRNTTLNTDDRLNFEHTLSGNILTLAGDGATGGVVGINTEGYSGVPKATLDIRGESFTNFPNLLLYDKLGGYSRLQFQNSSGPSHWLIAGLNGTVNSNERLNFYNSTSGDALSITGDGKIGIGTTTPEEKLTVVTGTNSNGITHSDGTIKLTTYVGGATNGAYFGTLTNHPLSFYTNNSSAQVTLLQSGDFLIGTNNLTSGAGYKLRVGGKIFSEEVRVQLQSSWPDYVFDKRYKKLSIDELEKYVNENYHLPNIPSAAEVEKDGQHLGEIQRKMLEKIEELSLYVIELKKEIDLLKSSNK